MINLRFSTLSFIVKTLRIHQWIKNLLVFIPLFAAHKFIELHLLLMGVKSFFSFCFCASSAYMINDLLDLSADRQHALKKHRPFAAGDLPINFALFSIPLLMSFSLIIALSISLKFIILLLVYFFITLTYSLYCKKVVLLDVILLALLYVIRIIGGGIATVIPISEWLLVFSLFFFLSLAFVKRISELYNLKERKEQTVMGRGYFSSDLEQISNFGSCSGYIAILVFALYINNDSVFKLYRHPEFMWLCCPILLYWISRMLLLAHRGQMHEDPILFAAKDKMSYLVGLLILLTLGFSK